MSSAQPTSQSHSVATTINLSQTIVTPEAIMYPIVYPDLGVTNDITNNHVMINKASTYNVQGKVFEANCDSMSISRVGFVAIPHKNLSY